MTPVFKALEKLFIATLCQPKSNAGDRLPVNSFNARFVPRHSKSQIGKDKIRDLIAFGIGSFVPVCEPSSGQWHLAMLLVLRDVLRITGTTYVWLPNASALEKHVLTLLGLQVLSTPFKSSLRVKCKTLFWTPSPTTEAAKQMATSVISTVIESNWGLYELSSVFFIAPDLAMSNDTLARVVDTKILESIPDLTPSRNVPPRPHIGVVGEATSQTIRCLQDCAIYSVPMPLLLQVDQSVWDIFGNQQQSFDDRQTARSVAPGFETSSMTSVMQDFDDILDQGANADSFNKIEWPKLYDGSDSG